MKDLFTGEISGVGYDGEGICRLDGKVVFLPYALKDEVVEFIKTDEKSKFIRGKVKRIIKKSEYRCSSPCPYFGKCGGCMLQHSTYENEIEIKKELLSMQLKKVGYFGDIFIYSSPKDYGYRNKIRLFVGEKGLSLKERGSNNLVAINKCMLVQGKINEAIEKINTFILLNDLQKDIFEVVFRQEGKSLLINFFVNNDSNINYQGIFLLLGADCGIFQTKNRVTQHVFGERMLYSNELGLNCEFSVASFHQVNAFLSENLYEGVIENIEGQRVINCYSGAGVLSGVIAKRRKEVYGIELGESEHNDAERLKKQNFLTNLTNICGDCSVILPQIVENADTIIVDPPRTGMSEKVCESINKSGCKRLIYVSCNSATLVRDIARLDRYKLQKVELYDMFPRTGEYEILCVLEYNQ